MSGPEDRDDVAPGFVRAGSIGLSAWLGGLARLFRRRRPRYKIGVDLASGRDYSVTQEVELIDGVVVRIAPHYHDRTCVNDPGMCPREIVRREDR